MIYGIKIAGAMASTPSSSSTRVPSYATPESRRAFEERFGTITMTAHIVAAQYQGAWIETHIPLEDGTVKKVFHEGGSEEAERIRQEVGHSGPAS